MPTKKGSGLGEDQQKPKTTRKKTSSKPKRESAEASEAFGSASTDQPIVYKEQQPKSVADAAPSADSFVRPLSASSLHKPAISGFTNSPMMPPASKNSDAEILRDIKKRESLNSRDASFLIPEKFGFDLKKSAGAPKGRWINILIYSLSTLIIALTILLFLLTFYSGKLLKSDNQAAGDGAAEQSQQNSEGGAAAESEPAAYKLSIQNLAADLQTQLTALLKDQNLAIDSTAALTLPAVQADTLFVKKSDNAQNTSLLNKLASLGIKAEIQVKEDLSADAALYLVKTLSKPDISGLTATVYNATGVAGLAKKYCAILTGYKASNCQALNATGTQSGSTVEYKNIKALFVLRRTKDFVNAKFVQAAGNQIEDLKVTVGK